MSFVDINSGVDTSYGFSVRGDHGDAVDAGAGGGAIGDTAQMITDLWPMMQAQAWQKYHMTLTDDQARIKAEDALSKNPTLKDLFRNNSNTWSAADVSQIAFGDKDNPGVLTNPAIEEARTAEARADAKAAAADARQAQSEARAEARAVRAEQLAAKQEARAVQQEFKAEHAGTYQLFNKYFGDKAPTNQQILDVAKYGDASQQEDYVRTMPSHMVVDGKTIGIGQYYDTRALADKVSMSVYGTASNDTIVQDLFHTGTLNDKQVAFYYEQLPFKPGKGKDVDTNYFNKVYNEVAPIHKALWNDEPHPLHLAAVAEAHAAANPTPATPGTPTPAPQEEQHAGAV